MVIMRYDSITVTVIIKQKISSKLQNILFSSKICKYINNPSFFYFSLTPINSIHHIFIYKNSEKNKNKLN